MDVRVRTLKRVLGELIHKFKPELYREEAKLRHRRISHDPSSSSYWSATFHELYVSSDKSGDSSRDDLLFYIQYDSKMKKEDVLVVRFDTKAIPEGDNPNVFWDETLYINLLLHEFTYCLTCCTLAADSSSVPLSARVIQRVELDVYPTHLSRRMDTKEEETATCYPNLNFIIDSFQELFGHLTLSSPGEKIAVQITATNPYLAGRRPIFVGGLDYKVLRASCDQKEEERKESGSLFQTLFRRKSLKNVDRFHFIPMEGPNGKGHAEMAICSIDSESVTSDDIPTPLEPSLPVDTNQPLGTSTPVDTSQPLEPSTPLSPTSPIFSVHTSNENLIGSDPKTKQSSTKKKGKRYQPKEGQAPIHTYLTFVQLPWYSVIEDILKSDKEPVL
ncbi:PREDICTED: uncharacterized protein KIAA0930 homolog [Amphimedon queenslandica]|nr:PREDICTED: uncharacterized protein KIAA0930 homolog [Amphimedon queenslandica]|eukprot:XP_011405856.1 PREDICTED: uncharacterized protein KIAA0930 homolog [Amphimedon queenslandica]